MFKRIMILMLCFCMAIGSSTIIFAGEFSIKEKLDREEIITPYMNYISRGTVNLTKIGSSKAKLDCLIYGYQGVTTKIVITAYLEEYQNGIWQTIRTYTQTSNSHMASMTRESAVSSGRSYRVTALVQAYSGTRSEIQIIRSSEVRF